MLAPAVIICLITPGLYRFSSTAVPTRMSPPCVGFNNSNVISRRCRLLSIFEDVGTKNKVTEFVCLAMETSTERQLGRFARFVRLLPPTTAAPPAAATATLPPNQLTMPLALPSHQPQLLLQPPQQLGGVAVPVVGASAGAPPAAVGAAALPPFQGVVNPLSSALPLPDVLQELQQWMASLGLNPGPRDAAGFSERGNFRYVRRLFFDGMCVHVWCCGASLVVGVPLRRATTRMKYLVPKDRRPCSCLQ